MRHVGKKSALGFTRAVSHLLLMLEHFHITVMLGIIDERIQFSESLIRVDQIV